LNLVAAVVIVLGAAAVSGGAMLLVRRRAPGGGYFADGDRAAGFFGVLATGLSVVLGFIIVLAFTSYDESRTGAEQEAITVAQQVETAQFLPEASSAAMTGQLVCYARSVVHIEWPEMEDGRLGEHINPWAVELYRSARAIDTTSSTQDAAFGKWLDQTSDREGARTSRVHGAVGVIPAPLWLMLSAATAIVFVFMLFFADSTERAVVQVLMITSVTCVITAMLLVLWMLDNPFHDGVGGLRPAAMERTLRVVDQELELTDRPIVIPCDANGSPRPR